MIKFKFYQRDMQRIKQNYIDYILRVKNKQKIDRNRLKDIQRDRQISRMGQQLKW